MKIFLGGTCNNSTWRDELIPLLKCDYFNPIVDDWNDEAYKRELKERETCDYCLYVITSQTKGVYSIAEVVDDSNKRPDKTIFTFLEEGFDSEQIKSLKAVGEMIKKNGAYYPNCSSIIELAAVLNYLNCLVQSEICLIKKVNFI